MTCEDLESKLLDAGTSKAVKIVRRMQAEKGCEIKPLLAKNDEFQKQERDRISANRIRSRQAIAPGRAVERLDRRQN